MKGAGFSRNEKHENEDSQTATLVDLKRRRPDDGVSARIFTGSHDRVRAIGPGDQRFPGSLSGAAFGWKYRELRSSGQKGRPCRGQNHYGPESRQLGRPGRQARGTIPKLLFRADTPRTSSPLAGVGAWVR